MDYLRPYAFPADHAVLAAWDSEISRLSCDPAVAEALSVSGRDLFARFAAAYDDLRRLPRGARRALQRRFACSVAGAALLIALSQTAAPAATITVNTLVSKIKDGDGLCSLIEAIVNANNDTATHADCAAGS